MSKLLNFLLTNFAKFSPNLHFFIDEFCKLCCQIAVIKSWERVWISFSPYSDDLFFKYVFVVEITGSAFRFFTLSANFRTTNPTTFGYHLLHPNISPMAKTGRANEENIAPRCALWLFFGVRTKFRWRGSQSAPPFARLVLRWRREEKDILKLDGDDFCGIFSKPWSKRWRPKPKKIMIFSFEGGLKTSN